MKAPNRIQVIAVKLSFGPKPAGAQLDWQNKVTSSFDFAALAAMLSRERHFNDALYRFHNRVASHGQLGWPCCGAKPGRRPTRHA